MFSFGLSLLAPLLLLIMIAEHSKLAMLIRSSPDPALKTAEPLQFVRRTPRFRSCGGAPYDQSQKGVFSLGGGGGDEWGAPGGFLVSLSFVCIYIAGLPSVALTACRFACFSFPPSSPPPPFPPSHRCVPGQVSMFFGVLGLVGLFGCATFQQAAYSLVRLSFAALFFTCIIIYVDVLSWMSHRYDPPTRFAPPPIVVIWLPPPRWWWGQPFFGGREGCGPPLLPFFVSFV